jgi:hypothetical protein
MAHEGIVSPLQAAGRAYLHKRLFSSASNWCSIVDILGNNEVRLVLSKMTMPVIQMFAQPEISEVRDSLADAILSVPNAVFVFQDLLSGESIRNAKQWDRGDFKIRDSVQVYDRDVPSLVTGLEYLRSKGFVLLPYRTRAEITLAHRLIWKTRRKGCCSACTFRTAACGKRRLTVCSFCSAIISDGSAIPPSGSTKVAQMAASSMRSTRTRAGAQEAICPGDLRNSLHFSSYV